ncbi:salt stress protein, Slr1339 family [Pseudanabaena sp. ABRG5-3]|uniref:salt stress protein, Slr1339 family n=1 Tax=Pseudanabaena sp. ABRG5-3 TaxID=685565 RepID=UPI000DC71059|nr:hypothetical protein [Pseudanabaena sp. ABRG5-3]BBC24616.1 hypothetical protein ABRG53_2359 [Pseudanabaena sp. ABRG5-3]
MESLESILTDLQNKYTDPNVNQQPKSQLKSERSQQDLPSLDIEVKPAITTNPSSLDRLLDDLRNGVTKPVEPEINVQPIPSTSSAINHDLQQVEDLQKAKDRQIYEQKAREWLKTLDPLCGEGLWFEEFAKNYPSKLEAAIAIIQSK